MVWYGVEGYGVEGYGGVGQGTVHHTVLFGGCTIIQQGAPLVSFPTVSHQLVFMVGAGTAN